MQLSWEVVIGETETIIYAAKVSHMLAFQDQDRNTEFQTAFSWGPALKAELGVMHIWWSGLPSSYSLLHAGKHGGLEREGEERTKKDPKYFILL